ncbi:MAG: DUF1640 domain-containing protein [Betaproteobacteria bacterium]|nr:DUF1640 domain-containing protein [Betaproteobacteria bacterium]
MATVTFDTHKFIRRLRDSGMPDEQAEALADALRDVQSEAELATKRDIQDLETRIREVELRLTVKIGGMLVIAVGVLAALLKLQ